MKRKIDTKIVKRFAKGDQKAFEEIYNFYKNSLYLFSVTLLRNQADAEEVVQETFVKVYQKIGTLKDYKTFHSWIFTINHNNAIKLYHKGKRQMVLDDEDLVENIVTSNESQKEDLDKQEVINVIKDELDQLPEKFLVVGQLRFLDGLTTKEISEVLEIPEGTVKNRLNRIRNTIKPNLNEKGFNPTSYFGFAGIPIMYQVFNEYLKQNTLSTQASQQIFSKVNALPFTNQIVKSSLNLSTLFIIPLAGVALISTSVLINSNQKSLEIREIIYTSEYVASGESVKIQLNQKPKENEILISYEDKELNYYIKDDVVIFQVINNGEYTIKTKENEEVIKISNIDNKAPVIEDIKYEGTIIRIISTDEMSGIDYESSYYLYDGESYAISKDGTIAENIKGDIVICLYDNVGNLTEYELNIS